MTDFSSNAEIADKIDTAGIDVPDLTEAARIANALGPKFPIKLHFQIEGILYEALIEQDDDSEVCVLSLRAIVNKLPFTSENPDKRNALKELVRHPDPKMPGKIFIDRAKRILFEMKTRLDAHQSHRAPELAASGYITAIVVCLIEAKPYLKTFRI